MYIYIIHIYIYVVIDLYIYISRYCKVKIVIMEIWVHYFDPLSPVVILPRASDRFFY